MSKKNDDVFTMFYEPHLAGNYRNNFHRARLGRFEMMYVRMLTELAANRFKWKNLPDAIDERFLELELLRNGGVLFHKYENENLTPRYMVSRFSHGGQVNNYDNPTEFKVEGNRIINKHYKGNEAVPIWANYLRRPDMDIIWLWASKLADIEITIETNVKNSRHTKVIAADQSKQLSWQNINRQYDEGVPVIYASGSFDVNEMTAFDLGPHHETIPNLLMAKGKMWDDCLSLLGVSVVNQDKKERMITGEVNKAEDQAKVTRNIALKSRQQAAHYINRMFGLNVSVDWMGDEETHDLNIPGLEDLGEYDGELSDGEILEGDEI